MNMFGRLSATGQGLAAGNGRRSGNNGLITLGGMEDFGGAVGADGASRDSRVQQALRYDPGHAVRTLSALNDLRVGGGGDVTCDMVLECDGRRFPVHRCLLLVHCPYFASYHEYQHTSNTVTYGQLVRITSTTPDLLHHLISYIYTGEVHVETDKLAAFLRLCDEYLMEELKLQIFRAIRNNTKLITTANCLQLWMTVKQLEEFDVLELCDDYILSNMNDIIRTDVLLAADAQTLCYFFSKDELIIDKEEDLLDFVFTWYKQARRTYQQGIAKLLGCIRFSQMNVDYIRKILDNDLIVNNLMYLSIPPVGLQPIRDSSLSVSAADSASTDHQFPLSAVPSKARLGPKMPSIIGITYCNNSAGRTQITCYSIHTHTWHNLDVTSKQPFLEYQTAVVYNDHIYLTGGIDNKQYSVTNVVEKYDMKSNKWISCERMPQARFHHAALTINNMIYLFGGFQKLSDHFSGQHDRTLLIYNVESNRWMKGADLPLTAKYMTGFVVNNNIYVYNSEDQAFLLQYDPNIGQWSLVNMFAFRRNHDEKHLQLTLPAYTCELFLKNLRYQPETLITDHTYVDIEYLKTSLQPSQLSYDKAVYSCRDQDGNVYILQIHHDHTVCLCTYNLAKKVCTLQPTYARCISQTLSANIVYFDLPAKILNRFSSESSGTSGERADSI